MPMAWEQFGRYLLTARAMTGMEAARARLRLSWATWEPVASVDPLARGVTSRSRKRRSPAGASESRSRGERGGAPLATQPTSWRATPGGVDRGARIAVASIGDGAWRVVAGAPGSRA